MPYLEPAIERLHGTHLADDVFNELENLHLHLWVFPNSAAVTEFVPYPQLMSCNVFLAGGDLNEILGWCNPFGPLEDWARYQGCSMIETTGRRGWAKRAVGIAKTVHVVRRITDG